MSREQGAGRARGERPRKTLPAPGSLLLLRSQTSTVQIRVMEKTPPPVRIISLGRVYRPDDADATHYPMFHQIEGLLVDRGMTMADLKSVLRLFASSFFQDDVHIRFRPSFFPFTEPSVEVDMSWQGRWIEMGGAGMVDPNVFRAVGYDPEEFTGFAFGLGIERVCMRRHNVTDIREFYKNDVRFLGAILEWSILIESSRSMLVSWNWLQQYVPLTMSPREFEQRLMMAGLNHEETHEVGDDLAIDLEVTSNRPDCLGHIGIAREVSVLWDCAADDPRGAAGGRQDAGGRPRARADRLPRSLPAVYGPRGPRRPRGAKPRLAGQAAGDDRHRGDQQRRRCLELRDDGMRPAAAHVRLCEAGNGPEIIVRRPLAGETIEAIDHKTYRLDADMCVIADARVPVAIGGVMGGAATEVNERPATC